MCVLNGPEHRFEYANPRYHDLIGHRDIMGRALVEALPEVEQQGFVALLDQVYATGETYSAISALVMLPAASSVGASSSATSTSSISLSATAAAR